MAHAARSLELIEGLIGSISTSTTTSQRNHIIKSLKEHNFARTNQFAVQSKLDGLIEKFGVLCRDDLATALSTRVADLPVGDKFLPDKLALLLELSNLPHLKVSTETLELLDRGEPTVEEEPELTDITKDDPLDGDIWENIERGYHSSGDEEDGGNSGRTTATSITSAPEDVESLARQHLTAASTDVISPASDLFTEAKLMRETLFMLRGHTADTYVVDHRTGNVYSSTSLSLHKTSRQTTERLIDSISETGSALNYLRGWCKTTLSAPHLRTCQAEIQFLLRCFDGRVSEQELSLVTHVSAIVVSVLQLCADIDAQAHALISLAIVIRRSTEASLLDELYEAACEHHATCDQAAFEAVYKVLLATLNTFLRPILQWAISGEIELQTHNQLVAEQHADCPLCRIWHDRYVLREGGMPAFLDSMKEELFAMGKAKMMLNLLSQDNTSTALPTLEFSVAAPTVDSLFPFSQHFQDCLHNHIATVKQEPGNSLIASLLGKHDVIHQFDVLEQTFLLKDAGFFINFSEVIYEHISRPGHLRRLNDFVVTQLARESVGHTTAFPSREVTASISAHPDASSIAITGDIRVKYAVPWYVANILRAESSMVHEDIFAFLLQMAIIKRRLQSQTTARRGHHSKQRLPHDVASVYALAHALIAVIDTLTSHITMAGTEQSQMLRRALQASTDMDEMIRAYEIFAQQLSLLSLTSPAQAILRKNVTALFAVMDGRLFTQALASTTGQEIAVAEHVAHAWQVFKDNIHAFKTALRTDTEHFEALEGLTEALSACLPGGGLPRSIQLSI